MWSVGGSAKMGGDVNRRVAVSMIALAIVVLGIFALPRLPVALLPNFTPPVVTVTVTYPNVGPEQMEALVTRPIENAVSRVNGIQLINSDSQLGQSTISAQFYYGTNLDTAAVDVQQQVAPERPQPAAAGDRQVQLELVAGRALLRDRRQHAAA
jgi:HAE1 family hydrophobic/amphiphilic exporter-1